MAHKRAKIAFRPTIERTVLSCQFVLEILSLVQKTKYIQIFGFNNVTCLVEQTLEYDNFSKQLYIDENFGIRDRQCNESL